MALLLPFSALLEQLGDQGGPARLGARAEAVPQVAVEVLVEEDEVPPVRVVPVPFEPAVRRPAAVGAAQEDPREAPRDLPRRLPQRHLLAGARRELHLELVA